MSEKEARAVGASGYSTMIAGKECQVKPLGIRELTEVERDCLDRYKRHCLETYSTNLDLLPEQTRAGLLERKLEDVSRWDVDSLPMKFAHDPSRIQLSDELKQWLANHWGLESDECDDARLRRLAVASLDQDALSAEDYKRMTGASTPKVKVPYIHWWITGCYDGMITLLWICFRHGGVTREQVSDAVGNDLAKLTELAQEIERLSSPQSGNG